MTGAVKAVSWTEQQREAIHLRGGALLVSAGAGSGKTAVLTERVAELLSDPVAPIPADELLIVTFTRAAAQEMRARITKKLIERSAAQPGNAGLQRQVVLLEQAQISTVHSFCRTVIQENFDKLGVSPEFRVADERECLIWEAEAVQQVLSTAYESGTPAFFELVELFSTHRDDRQLQRTVQTLYTYLRSHPFYEHWMSDTLALYGATGPVQSSVWGEVIWAHAAQALEYAHSEAGKALALMADGADDGKMTAAYGPALMSYEHQICDLLECHMNGDWDGLREKLSGLRHERFGALRAYEDTGLKEQVTTCRDRIKETLAQLGGVLCCTEAQFYEDLADLAPKLKLLFELTRSYGAALDAIKSENEALDFSDLEHMALSLLLTEAPHGSFDCRGRGYAPTDYAAALSQRLAAVFVDEYQDTNEVQELIYLAVSGGGDKLFMVGDVKQSIYRFRQARPEIFLEKRRRSAHYTEGRFPAYIELNANFRSSPELLRGVNGIFERLMSARVGDVNYRDGEQLIAGATQYPPPAQPACELHLLELAGADADGDKLPSTEQEAAYVAAEVARLLASDMQVQGEGGLRPLRPEDICILLRSPKNKAPVYERALEAAGVSAAAEASKGFLGSREVRTALSLLKIIDNPLLDIELAAVLLSPVIGFTADDLAALYGGEGRGSAPLYILLTQAAQGGDERCAHVTMLLGRWRMLAATLPTHLLLARLYDETLMEAIVAATPSGAQRRENLRLLIEYAEGYEAHSTRGLPGFLSYMSRLAEQGEDLREAAVAPPGGCVQIMSVHRSKGLEFPVVFLCDTAKQFNIEDLGRPALVHAELGFACKRRNFTEYREFTTLPMQAIKLDLMRQLQSEEMRVLYVALTRAKEKLILTGAVADAGKALGRAACAPMPDGSPPAQQVFESRSFLSWVLMALCAEQPDLAAGDTALCLGGSFLFKVVAQPQCDTAADGPGDTELIVDGELLAQLREQAAWQYPHRRATELPGKLAVSALSAGAAGEGDTHRFAARPAFLYEHGLTPAERGSALHKFMQFCDYTAAREDAAAELARLVEHRYLLPAEGAAVDTRQVDAFFASELAVRMFASGDVRRELRFLAEVGSSVLAPYLPDTGENKIAVQGVADCVFIEGGGAVLIDYKTDHVTSPEQLIERYAAQLNIYEQLLGEVLGVPVREKYIYSFHLGRAIAL